MRPLAVALLLTLPLSAQTVEERLSSLEQEVRALRAENQELRRMLTVTVPAPVPATTPAKPAVAAPEIKPAGKASRLSIGGFVHAQAEAGGRVDPRFSDDNDRIFLRRTRLNAGGVFAEGFDFKVELELSGTLASSSGLRAQATDAYAGWTKYPAANVRIGQLKAPFGLEQMASDLRILTPERTLGTDRITPARQIGVQVAGELAKKRFGYALGVFNGNGTNVSSNDDEGFMTAGRVTANLLTGDVKWTAGANGYTSDDRNVSVAPELGFANSIFAGSRHAWGIDSQFTSGPVDVWVELMRAEYDPATGGSRELSAAYVMGAYSLTEKLQAVARYDTYDVETADMDTWTVGGNYYIKGHDLKLQLHLMHTGEDDRVLARVQTIF